MGLTNENVGPKILAKIKIYVLTRAELLFPLCYEIPCRLGQKYKNIFIRFLVQMKTCFRDLLTFSSVLF